MEQVIKEVAAKIGCLDLAEELNKLVGQCKHCEVATDSSDICDYCQRNRIELRKQINKGYLATDWFRDTYPEVEIPPRDTLRQIVWQEWALPKLTREGKEHREQVKRNNERRLQQLLQDLIELQTRGLIELKISEQAQK